LTNFEVIAEIIRKDLHWEEDWEGFEYGLRFVQILDEDRQKLQHLLSGRYQVEDYSNNP
jgi:hypothetical protein